MNTISGPVSPDLQDIGPVEVYRSSLFEGLHHGFLGRSGGVSSGIVSGLNVGLGSGDEPRAIARNRALAVEAVFPGAHLLSVYQVHSADCVTLRAEDEIWPETHRPHADAIVTNRRNVLLGIVTADCAPVLFADHEAGVVGAAHAGWKGALSGVTDATIEAMEALGARRDRIVAAVGPCIAQASYEVDDAFKGRFVEQSQDATRYFMANRTGHHLFDLEGYVLDRLQSAGVNKIQGLNLDTYSASRQFYSFRRATHLSEPTYGRQISLIGLP